MDNITFSPSGWDDYCYWQSKEHIKTLAKIGRLLEDIRRNGPAQGLGKPEPLRHERAWSRRIDDANRLVYTEENGDVIVLACRGHYEDK